MFDRGKLAVLSMLGLAVVMATFAWFWNFRRGERCLAFYGSQAAALIRAAPTVEILDIDPAASEALVVTRRIDISHAPGLLNARAALLDDASFVWDAPPALPAPAIAQLLRFASGSREVLLRFDSAQRTLQVLPAGKIATLDEKTAAGWQQFLDRYK